MKVFITIFTSMSEFANAIVSGNSPSPPGKPAWGISLQAKLEDTFAPYSGTESPFNTIKMPHTLGTEESENQFGDFVFFLFT